MPAQKASNIMRALLLLCMALSLTACLPKDLFKVSADQAHQEAVASVDTLDAELAMDREIEEASLSPSSLVGSENVSVSSLSSHDALFGSSLELAEEDYSLLPAGLMMLEGPEALPEQKTVCVLKKIYKINRSHHCDNLFLERNRHKSQFTFYLK